MSLKIFYAAGPGNIIEAHRNWRERRDDPSEMALTYSGQFEDMCEDLDATAYIVSSHPSSHILKDGRFTLEHRPKPAAGAGVRFHLSELLYALDLLWIAIRFRADVAVISSGTTHYFLLSLFRMFGIKVVPVLHNSLWPKDHPRRSWAGRLITCFDGAFFRRHCDGVIGISPECARQVQELCRGRSPPTYVMSPQYRREHFEGSPEPPQLDDTPFTIVFSGRVERDKGVFDVLTIAKTLDTGFPGRVKWHICGSGAALEDVKASCAKLHLQTIVQIHGWTLPSELRRILNTSHLSIVPTSSRFAEGMAKSAIEAILVGRPVIASSVTPALEVLRPASIEVKADDVQGYVREITDLLNREERYKKLAQACDIVQEQFYDRRKGFAAALVKALRSA